MRWRAEPVPAIDKKRLCKSFCPVLPSYRAKREGLLGCWLEIRPFKGQNEVVWERGAVLGGQRLSYIRQKFQNFVSKSRITSSSFWEEAKWKAAAGEAKAGCAAEKRIRNKCFVFPAVLSYGNGRSWSACFRAGNGNSDWMLFRGKQSGLSGRPEAVFDSTETQALSPLHKRTGREKEERRRAEKHWDSLLRKKQILQVLRFTAILSHGYGGLNEGDKFKRFRAKTLYSDLETEWKEWAGRVNAG